HQAQDRRPPADGGGRGPTGARGALGRLGHPEGHRVVVPRPRRRVPGAHAVGRWLRRSAGPRSFARPRGRAQRRRVGRGREVDVRRGRRRGEGRRGRGRDGARAGRHPRAPPRAREAGERIGEGEAHARRTGRAGVRVPSHREGRQRRGDPVRLRSDPHGRLAQLQGRDAHGRGVDQGSRAVREPVRRRPALRLPPVLLSGLPPSPRDRDLPEGRADPSRRGGDADMTTYRIGVDTGDTFTDCIVVDDDGNVTAAKAASTPQDFSVGVMDSVARAAQRLGLSAEQLLAQTTRFGHGTTVATNALITHTGARTGILTTRGHEDALFMGRIKQKIAGLDEDQIHDFLLHDKAVPGIVPRKLIKGLNERVDRKGAVIVAMNDDEVRRLAGELVGAGCEAIAISLLWSFLNPSHERRARDIVREAYPNVTVSISCEISPVLGEYERTASTMVNAYLTKKVDGYIGALADRLRKAGFKHQLMVMLSNGGVTPAEDARRRAAYLLA